jgi:hypothetical protein
MRWAAVRGGSQASSRRPNNRGRGNPGLFKNVNVVRQAAWGKQPCCLITPMKNW